LQYIVSYDEVVTIYNVEMPPKLNDELYEAKLNWKNNPTLENYNSYIAQLTSALE
jgi:hypothetical protein